MIYVPLNNFVNHSTLSYSHSLFGIFAWQDKINQGAAKYAKLLERVASAQQRGDASESIASLRQEAGLQQEAVKSDQAVQKKVAEHTTMLNIAIDITPSPLRLATDGKRINSPHYRTTTADSYY